MKEVRSVAVECQMIALFPFYFMLTCDTPNFLIQLKHTLTSISSPLKLIVPHHLLSDLLVFLFHCSYVLVRVSSSSEKSINLVH